MGWAKGQVSLEYLVISLVAVALISVSVFALVGIRGYADKTSGLFSFRASALSLANAVAEVCALGSGNGRSVVLESPLSVECEGPVMRIVGRDSSLVRPARCAVEPASGLSGAVYVKNEGGTVTITRR